MDGTIDFPAYRRGKLYPRLASLLFLLLPRALSAAPCDPPVTNPILCENTKVGNPSTEWEVSGSGDPSIQGFATDISVNHGTTVHFKVNTNASDYRIDIYRLGYYGGLGARKVATVQPSAVLPQVQPACLNDPATGLNDCGNWAESASWAIPADAVSGIYIARLVREDASPGESHMVFIVRDDEGHSPILFQTSDTTWQAYNQYGGNSLYVGGPGTNPGRAYKVSYNRPFTTRGTSNEDWLFNSEYPMIRWLEANGYNVSYFTGVDSDRIGNQILDHQVFLSVGHDEYWSGGQRANVEAARTAGKHLAFFSGNEIFWKTRWESSIDASATPYRTLVCYKETHAGAKIDPNPGWTGTWRDNRPINPSPNPENALTGNIFTVNCCSYPMTVGSEDGKLRLWRNTSVANLGAEDVATFPDATVGYEWNEDLDNGARPAGTFRLSSTNVDVPQRILDQGSTYGPGNATHSLTIYRHSSGALVFGAGTVQWMWGLDSNHDRGSDAPDVRMRQATVNLFADMGVQPDALQGGLVSATPSADATPASSQVTAPTAGTTLPSGSPFLVTGTASDSGGLVGGVEVSTDGGTTWHRATGRASWSYSWTPGAPGSAVIRSRATDDSGNIETPSAGVSVTVGAASCPCSIWNDSFTPGHLDPNDHQGVEVGVKFRSDTAGFVTGIRFYKGPTNTGAHVGHLWTSGGALLGTATFSGESPTGWEQATFASPIAISPNTTYVASYFAPVGQYAFDGGYFASAFDNAPLHALADGTDGSNGVYKYGGGFPTDTYNQSNYWVDVIFSSSAGNDTTPPSVLSVTPFDGAPAVAATANATATFNEPLDASTVTSSTFTLQGPGGPVAAAVSWDPATLKATLDPTSSLAFSTTYTTTLKSGAAGIKDLAGNALASDYTWSFTTAAPPPPPPDQGPGGPILVVAGANAFGRYYAEILRAEGLNAFDVKDIVAVNATVLGGYDVVILGEQPLNAAQATMFSDWVNAGGNLIAMRPDADMYGLLGITAAGGALANAYFLVDTSAAPGAGIVTQTMQFHGTADKYTLSGATAVATLYSDASTATGNPAVTTRSVGSNGGHAAAFAFDLARSVVYTRQGNPLWAGDSRDGQDGPIRSDNLFFGAKAGDVQPDWIDFTKVAIPQADEAQRLLANLIGTINLPRKPLPRFWYFPKGKKAAVIMTGDDHASGGTAGRFDAYKAASNAGCSVADWDCIRSTSYIYANAPLTDSQAVGYEADGFEVGLHVTTGCDNFTPSSLETDFADQLAAFTAKYGSVSPPATNRTHCIAWSDWSTHPKTELAHGIRLDTNYYYWPPAWIADRPGMFTGSGMPMRFADLDGTMIDVYQATTQMTDESGQTFPKNIDALLDKATGAEGYYGAFTANMHTDSASSSGSDAIVASAKAHGVPVVSSRQMLSWLDGRNGSSFQSLAWAGTKLTFTISVGAGASNLQAMVPAVSAAGGLTGVTRNGAPVSFTTQTIKGVSYAFVPALAGAYEAQYAVDTTPPVISAVVATPGSGDATVTWTTDEASTSIVDFGTSAGSLGSQVGDGALVTSHSIHLTGLSPSTTYYFRVTSADAANNPATAPNPPAAPASFATTSLGVVDTTVADFSAGTTGANTAVSQIANGEVILASTVDEEFGGTTLPASWTGNAGPPWPGGGSVGVSSGFLSVDGARAYTNASYGSGRVLEFVATFGTAMFQHLGFASDGDSNAPWVFFSTKDTTDTLFARTQTGSSPIDHAIPGSWLGSPHIYRIEWNAASVRFLIDGTLVDTQTVSIAGPLRLLASDFNTGGATLSVDWIRLSPYVSSGTFTSRVFDAGQTVGWGNASWTAGLPAGTAIALAVRTGNTSVPDGTWTTFTSISNGGAIPGSSRYIQYQATLTTSDPTVSPILQDVTLGYSVGVTDTTPPTIAGRTPSPNATNVSPDTNVTVQFSEPMNASTINGSTMRLRKQGAGSDVAAAVSYGGNTATLDPNASLAPNAVYQVTVAGTVTDVSSNPLGNDDTWTFTTGAITGSATDTTTADFSAGTLDVNTRVSQIGDGEVILAGAVNEEFSGSALPAGWSGAPWGGGGSVAVSGGQLTVDGSRAVTDASFGSGTALEFVATFGAAAFEHVGFAGDFDSNPPWIFFSTKNTTDTLYARTQSSGGSIDNPIPGSWIGSPHRYRIEWSASSVRFLIDGNIVDTQSVSIPNSLRILASEFNGGAPSLSVDWLRLSPYAAAGTFLSRIFDGGAGASWTTISSTRDLPAGTSIALSVRSGATPAPDGSWSAFTPVPGSGGPLSSTSRYLQYSAGLATSDPLQTPALRDVTVGFTVSPVTHTLTVTRTGTGAATSTVTSTPAGISCPSNCVKTFDGGTVVTLLPMPGATYVFGGWSGDADCADGVVTLDADKTCTAAFNKKPDLTVSVLGGPASAAAGATIAVTDTTKNLAGGPAFPGTSNTKIWLSTDAVLDGGDTLLGTRAVPSLNPGISSAGSTNVVIPAGQAPGSYFLIANADADGSVPESNEANNVRTKAITVLGPDLQVTVLTAPTVSGANRTISISDTTRNTTGASSAPASTTTFYLSTDAVWDGGDIPFGSRNVPALAGGAQSALTANQTLPAVANGNYYIIAKADGPLAIAESSETNNTRAKAIVIGADLSVSAVGGPATSGAGLQITVTDTTANAAGRSDVPDSTTAYYLSSDAVLGAGDTLLNSRSTGPIPSGGSSAGSASVTIPAGAATGTWYIIAKADDPNAVFETSETNNTRAKSIAIGPDLIVSAIVAPLSAHPGQTINVTPTTKNQGGGSSGVSSTTKIYLRPSSGPDIFLGSRPVPALAPNTSSGGAALVMIPAGTPTGSYNLFVVADDGNAVVETIETNNTKLKAITIN